MEEEEEEDLRTEEEKEEDLKWYIGGQFWFTLAVVLLFGIMIGITFW